MNNVKILVSFVVVIFLVVTSVVRLIISLNDQSTTSLESKDAVNNTEDTNITSNSTESVTLFYSKFFYHSSQLTMHYK